MARGGHGTGAGIPLRDRVRRDGTTATPEAATETVEPAEAAPGRHCWISTPVDGGDRRPGLLVEWRKTDRWEGRVYYPALLRSGRWGVVEEWLPAEVLTTD